MKRNTYYIHHRLTTTTIKTVFQGLVTVLSKQRWSVLLQWIAAYLIDWNNILLCTESIRPYIKIALKNVCSRKPRVTYKLHSHIQYIHMYTYLCLMYNTTFIKHTCIQIYIQSCTQTYLYAFAWDTNTHKHICICIIPIIYVHVYRCVYAIYRVIVHTVNAYINTNLNVMKTSKLTPHPTILTSRCFLSFPQ